VANTNDDAKTEVLTQGEELNELLKVRRDKLAKLQKEGKNPFHITRFDPTSYSQQIFDNFEEMEEKPVVIAGRIMSKRIMGKASFAHILDAKGQIQIYVQITSSARMPMMSSKHTISGISLG